MQQREQATPIRTKLLAPAGGPEAGYAAFRYGADAVYCGLRSFSARASALNFSPEELRELVHYAHSAPRPREVYVTLNTLVAEGELPVVAETVAAVVESGADALIVQDYGVARIARAVAPSLVLHASTQMAVHSLEGARAATRLGFGQVTLAREMTFEEISQIAAEGIATEVFIHGALCYSYSGLCLMSAVRNGRSGNRGRCAYPCRERYSLDSHGGGLAFSMKDLALGEDVRRFAEAGVSCLKIEGRMKSPLYVAATTDFYRRILDGAFADERELRRAAEDVMTVFSRKQTRLNFGGVRHCGNVDANATGHGGAPVGAVESVRAARDGVRWLEFRTSRDLQVRDGLQIELPDDEHPFGFSIESFDAGGARRPVFERAAGEIARVPLPPEAPRIPVGAPVSCASSQDVKQRFDTSMPPAAERTARTPVDAVMEIRQDGVALRMSARGIHGESRLEGAFNPARDIAAMERAAAESCAKLGDTAFAPASFQLHNPDALFVPVSQMNELRRQACAALHEKLVAESALRHERMIETAAAEMKRMTPRAPDAPERWIVRADRFDTLADIDDADEVVLDIDGVSDEEVRKAAAKFGKGRIRLALPIVTRSYESAEIRRRIAALTGMGFTRWLAANISAWEFLPQGCDIAADWTLSAWNTPAIRELMARGATGVTLSPECGVEELCGLAATWGDVAAVVLHQDTPLMISESCPISALGAKCGECPPKAEGRTSVALHAQRGDDVVATMRNCRTFITNMAPLSLARHVRALRDAGCRNWRVDFCLREYTAAEAAEIWRGLRDS